MRRTFIRKLGKKGIIWKAARARLVQIYRQKGFERCERCGSTFALSFHHLDKRSHGEAQHTFNDTRLLCAGCHTVCEYDKEENDKLRIIR